MGRGSDRARTERGAGATQLVVGIVFVVAFLSVGPWFAGKVGPGLSDLLHDLAQPSTPCPAASASPGPRPKRVLKKPARPRPKASASPRRQPAATPSSTCPPRASERPGSSG